ncbi:MAG: HNH endonuclease [Burkholderiaceae bacterium]|nr:HNH endonuclease [Burkholderiaceae bacterium]
MSDGYLKLGPRFSGRPPIPLLIRRLVLERDGRQCLRCGSTDHLALDHIQPWSEGGRHLVDNLQVLCAPCNRWKGTRMMSFRRQTAGAS